MMAALAGELSSTKEDRDAERTQKEALRVELEEARSAIRRLLAYPFDLRGEIGSLLHADLVEAAQQPAEAAPVAKAEAPSEPAGWVPHVEETCRVVDTNEIVTVKAVYTAGPRRYDCLSDDGDLSNYMLSDLEPAPQPPATPGGDSERGVLVVKSTRRVLSDASGFVTRAELVTALGACRGRLGGSASALAGMLADELEKAK
jgi:hypothetical protein